MRDVVISHPNLDRAQAALARLDVRRSEAVHGSARSIAMAVGAAVKEAVNSAAPYSSHGAVLDISLDVAHRSADGAQTGAKIHVRYGRGE